MARIRPETEEDRTREAVAAEGLTLPLARGSVQIDVPGHVAGTAGGQRLTTLLVNILARMKGVTTDIHLAVCDTEVLPGVPLRSGKLTDGLAALAASVNTDDSKFRASLTIGHAPDPSIRVQVGGEPGSADIITASDAWRALQGDYAAQADWTCACPIGSSLAAAITAAEIFKRIVAINTDPDWIHLAPADFAYSAFNYRTGPGAEAGPDIPTVRLTDTAIIGCGAGGSGTAYITAMHPRVTGKIALIEPGSHKLSNLNRYLATTAQDVHQSRHKLSTLVDHLARFTPSLGLELHARPWEQLDDHPWRTLISAVDTIEGRWNIQARAPSDATIIDLAVDDLLYAVLRVTPGGRCLYCKHPYDPDLALKQRALRWGVSIETVRNWTSSKRAVDKQMLESLSQTQGRPATEFAELLGIPFTDTPAPLECGSTALQADVPSQMPILPLATSAVSVIGAAELIKQATGLPGLENWLAHDLRRNPSRPWQRQSQPLKNCPHHQPPS